MRPIAVRTRPVATRTALSPASVMRGSWPTCTKPSRAGVDSVPMRWRALPGALSSHPKSIGVDQQPQTAARTLGTREAEVLVELWPTIGLRAPLIATGRQAARATAHAPRIGGRGAPAGIAAGQGASVRAAVGPARGLGARSRKLGPSRLATFARLRWLRVAPLPAATPMRSGWRRPRILCRSGGLRRARGRFGLEGTPVPASAPRAGLREADRSGVAAPATPARAAGDANGAD
jgi:hypothetical protein